jgi:hypothetical protein
MNKKNMLIIASGAIVIFLIIIIVVIANALSSRPTAKAGSVYDGTSYLQAYQSSGTALQDLPEIYGFSQDAAESVLNNPDEWKAYKFEVAVNNKSKETITLNSYSIKKNGKNDVWVSTVAEPKVNIIGGNTETISIVVLVMGKDVTAEDAAQAIQKYSVKIVYSATPTISQDGKESIEKSKTITVK